MACWLGVRLVCLGLLVGGCDSEGGDSETPEAGSTGEAGAETSGESGDAAPGELPWETADPLFDAEMARADAWCACYEGIFEYERAKCIESFGPRTRDACEADVLFNDLAAVPRLECLIAANEDEASCFAAESCPADQGSICKQAAFDAEQACPDYPSTVVSALNGCHEPEPFWFVGDEGVIFGIDPEGNANAEQQPTQSDFQAIVCDGAANAWIVGERGTVLRTVDAGASWSVIELDTDRTLRAVAQVDSTNVVAVGDDGAVFQSSDGGVRWEAISGPHRDWRGVTAGPAGAWMFVAAQGEIWSRPAGGSFTEAYRSDVALHDIDAHHHGIEAAAVGDGGLLVRSLDGGAHWTTQPTPTDLDLYTVDVVGNDAVVAAGEDGVIVRWDGRGVRQVAGSGPAIFDLHVTSDGSGAAVGEAGTLVVTHDGGDTWLKRELGLDADLRGLDQPFHPH